MSRPVLASWVRPLAVAAAVTLASAACGSREPAVSESGTSATPAAAPVDPAGHPRHHARRRHRPRGRRRPDAGVQRAGRRRPAVPAGLRDGARDAAVARLDDDRPLSGRPRRPRERPVAAAGPGPARRAAARGRLRDGGVRVVVHPGAAVRPGARVRPTTTSLRAGHVERNAPRHHRRRARVPDAGQARQPAVPVGALLRPARPVRAARAVPQRGIRRRPYLGRGGVRWTSSWGGWSQAFEAAARGAARRSSSSATTARASAITARRCTATCSTSPRCTCRWSIAGPGVDGRRERRAGQHRRIFHTVLDWAGLDAAGSLRRAGRRGRRWARR